MWSRGAGRFGGQLGGRDGWKRLKCRFCGRSGGLVVHALRLNPDLARFGADVRVNRRGRRVREHSLLCAGKDEPIEIAEMRASGAEPCARAVIPTGVDADLRCTRRAVSQSLRGLVLFRIMLVGRAAATRNYPLRAHASHLPLRIKCGSGPASCGDREVSRSS